MIKNFYSSNVALVFTMLILSVMGLRGQSVLTNSGGLSISGNTTITVLGSVENNSGAVVDELALTSSAVVSDDITNNGIIDGRGSITLNGDWYNNNTFTCHTGIVNFSGVHQALSGSVSSTFYDLNLDGSGIKTQTIDQTTTNILDLNSVELATTSYTMYVTNASAAAITRVNGFVSSTVGGALSRVTNSAASYLFPTGSSTGTVRYRPVALTPVSTAANTYEVRMANYTPTTEGFNVGTKEAIICEVNPQFFHLLNHTSGTDLTTVRVYYDNVADGSWNALGNWLATPSVQWYEIAGSSTSAAAPFYVATATDQTLPAAERSVALTKHALTVDLGSDVTVCAGSPVVLDAGNPGATYIWSNSATSQTISVSSSGLYAVTVTNPVNGCETVDAVNITIHSLPTVAATADDPDFCIGGNTTITASGAGSYSWSGLGTNISYMVAPLVTTEYTVTGMDGNGCTNSASVTVTVHPEPAIVATADYPSLCPGESTPITGSGGTSYLWDNGLGAGLTHTVSPLVTTTYHVTGTDMYGCTNTAEVTVTLTTAPAVVASAADPSICVGETTTISGGGALNYIWDNGLGAGASFSVNPGITTTYQVTGSSATGCSATAEVTVTVNPNPTISASVTDATVCNGENTTISASGGDSYLWSNGLGTNASNIVNPSTTTTYTVTGSSAAGCSNLATVTVNVNALPVITAMASDPTLCNGESTTINAGGGDTYIWDNSLGAGVSHTVNPATTTTYEVTGVDGNGCSNIASVVVVVNDLPSITAGADYPDLCVGESATITGNGGVSYEWDNGLGLGISHLISPLVTTTYQVTGTDVNGCQNTASVLVNVFDLPTVVASADHLSVCSGGSVTLTGSGAASFIWDQGLGAGSSFTISPSATTTYVVTGSTTSGCSNSASITITVNPLPSITASASDAEICSGNNTTISVAGGNTYNWSNSLGSSSSYIVTPTASTTYSVTGTDVNGCTGTAEVVVTVNPLPVITAVLDEPVVCEGDSTNLSAGGGNDYLWDQGLGTEALHTVSPSTTTVYAVTGTDLNGCSNTANVTLTINPVLDAAMNPAGPFCSNDAVETLTAVNGGGTWQGTGISNPVTGEFNPALAGQGTHQIIYTTGGSCPDSDTMDIVVNEVISATINAAGPFCETGSDEILTAATNGGVWSGTGITNTVNGTFSPVVAGVGSHEVVYTTSGICPDSDTVQIMVNPQADASIVAAGPYCDNEAAVTMFAVEPGGIWSGTGFTNTSSGTWDPALAGAGSHNITYAISGACGDTASATIVVNETPDVIVTCFGESCFGANDGFAFVDISGGTAPYFINWDNAETTDTIDMLPPGTYDVSVSDANGCTRTASGTVDVSSDSCYTPHVFIPNIFSPNGDANNDVYLVQGKGITNFTLRIYDRWGEKVFETTDLTSGWDGEFNGKPVEQGAYPYAVSLIFEGETTVREYNGYITIVR